MAIFDYKIDKVTPIPLYFQLKKIILEELENGNYPEGSLIPTESEIGEAFGLSRTTVRQAITELVQEGKLYRIKSKGTFVAKPKLMQDFVKRLETYNETIRRLGMVPSTKLLEMTVVPAPSEVADILKLESKEKCIMITRLRFADQEPNVLVKTWLPLARCQFVLQHNLENESLYSILSKDEDTRVFHITRTIEAILASAEIARQLGIGTGDPVHFFCSTGFNPAGQPIEFSRAYYRGDRNRFEVDLYYTPENS